MDDPPGPVTLNSGRVTSPLGPRTTGAVLVGVVGNSAAKRPSADVAATQPPSAGANNGPGGARFIAGDLWNDGLVTLNSVLLFDRDDAEVVNRGLFEAAPFSGAAVTGRRGIFRQVAGEVRFADSSSRFEFYHGSRFIYEGGNVFGEPLLAGSTAVISPAVTTDVSLRFVGVGSVYDGAITANRTVKLDFDFRFGVASLRLTNVSDLRGRIQLTAGLGDPSVALTLPAEGLRVAPEGIFRVNPSTASALVLGDLTMEGQLAVAGSLSLSSQTVPFINRGTIHISSAGRFESQQTIVQTDGALNLAGGKLVAGQGLVIEGGLFQAGGVIVGQVTNRSLAVVEQFAAAKVTGDWQQATSGTLRVVVHDITDSPDAAALEISGLLALQGALEVKLGLGTRLADGAVLNLAKAGKLRGWFERITLPELPTGFHWHILPSATNVRLAVRDTPPPVLVELLRDEEEGDRLRLTGPLGGTTMAAMSSSTDLKDWNAFQQVSPFSGLAYFPVPRPVGSATNAVTLFQAVVTPLTAPDRP